MRKKGSGAKPGKIGNRYGCLTVMTASRERLYGELAYVCLCDCGRLCTVGTGNLRPPEENGNYRRDTRLDCGCGLAVERGLRKHKRTVKPKGESANVATSICWTCGNLPYCPTLFTNGERHPDGARWIVRPKPKGYIAEGSKRDLDVVTECPRWTWDKSICDTCKAECSHRGNGCRQSCWKGYKA